jgi:predicted RND superfamily exporter protein
MVEAAQRVVPGAPPTASTKAANKKKKQHPNNNGSRSDSQEAISKAATSATLMDKAPSRDKIDESVKVQAKDLAEEAERNGAIAAVELIKFKESEKDGHVPETENKSALQVILSKRIKVLSKKLQRAITYEALEEDKLNADMKRIIASKPALEASVAELTETLKALEVSDVERK